MSKADVANERKRQIVQATVDCISKLGYHNFSMQDVANRAGVSKGIIHYYFLSKDELMMSVLEVVAENIEKSMVEEMKEANSPVARLEVFMNACFNVVAKTKEYYQVNMDFWTQINQKSEVKKAIAKHYKTFRETVASVIREGVADGSFRSVDPIFYASFIISIVDGLTLQWLFDKDTIDYDIMKVKAQDIIKMGLLRDNS